MKYKEKQQTALRTAFDIPLSKAFDTQNSRGGFNQPWPTLAGVTLDAVILVESALDSACRVLRARAGTLAEDTR